MTPAAGIRLRRDGEMMYIEFNSEVSHVTQPKQHHYIHESYLEQFMLDDKPLTLVDKWQNGRVFPGKPKSVLKESYYYSQPVQGERRLDPKLETFFSQIEGHWPEIVSTVRTKKIFSNELYGQFIQCLIMFRVRVPNTRKAIEACLRHLANELSDEADEPLPPEILLAFSAKSRAISMKSKTEEIYMRDLLDEGLVHVEIDPHRSIGAMPQLADLLAPFIVAMRSRSFLHNGTDINFITSDNPVIIFGDGDSNDLSVPYPTNCKERYRVIFPLTPRVVFFYDSREKRREQHRILRSTNTVNKINLMIARFADRFIVGSDRQSVEKYIATPNTCPVPDFKKCAVRPGLVEQLAYKFGSPIQMNGWKNEFQEQDCV